jgi:hypothetical protein
MKILFFKINMEKYVNMEAYNLIEISQKENNWKNIALISMIAIGLTGCMHYDIPEDCSLSNTEARGIFAHAVENGANQESAQATLDYYCEQ